MNEEISSYHICLDYQKELRLEKLEIPPEVLLNHQVYVFRKIITDSNVSLIHERHASCCCSWTRCFSVSYPWVYEWEGSILRLTLDHADIIGSISNGQGDGPLVPLHQLHHLGFLHRSDPAADDCFTQTGQVQQDVLQLRLQSVSLQGEPIQCIAPAKPIITRPITSTPCRGNTEQQLDVTLPPSCLHHARCSRRS